MTGSRPQVHLNTDRPERRKKASKEKQMKKFLGIMLVLGLVCGFNHPSFGGQETVKGHFITKDGKYQPVDEFMDLKGESFFYKSEGKELSIPYAEIKSLTYFGDDKILVKKRNGKELRVNKSYLRVGSFAFYDPVSMKYSTEMISNHLIKKIVFDDDFGEMRKCLKCGRTYPPDYLFCPYDRTKLRLIKIQ